MFVPQAEDVGDVPSNSGRVPDARFVVRYRAGGRGEWKTVGVANTYAEAVAMADRAGDWWFSECGAASVQ